MCSCEHKCALMSWLPLTIGGSPRSDFPGPHCSALNGMSTLVADVGAQVLPCTRLSSPVREIDATGSVAQTWVADSWC